MAATLLVTGLSGFVGSHIQQLADAGALGDFKLLQPPAFDLLDPASLRQALPEAPDAVLHLAAQSHVPTAFADPAGTLHTNLLGTLNLLQALQAAGFNGSFLYVSSGDVYGQVAESDLPISEVLAPKPRNPYGVSKAAAELLCQQWSYQQPWRIMIARPFNHIGPGQSEDFVISSMARQIIRIKRGQQPPQIQVGDVDVSRDFLDVRDVISAYLALLSQGRNTEIYNLCSGQAQVIRVMIQRLLDLAGVDATLVQDPARMRRAEQRRVAGNPAKLKQTTGWAPAWSLDATLGSILEDWDRREQAS